MLRHEKYSIGVGDRFAHQAKAPVAGVPLAGERGDRCRARVEQVVP